jgi:hypothetical protein
LAAAADLDIAKLPDGTFWATMARPLLVGFDGPIPAAEFRHEPTQVHLGWRPLNVTFDGQLADGKLTGKWTEEGETYRVTFERSQ